MTNPKQGEIYRHHSGKLYEIQEPVYYADTGDAFVAYKEFFHYDGRRRLINKTWIHTVENFNKKGRFEKVR